MLFNGPCGCLKTWRVSWRQFFVITTCTWTSLNYDGDMPCICKAKKWIYILGESYIIPGWFLVLVSMVTRLIISRWRPRSRVSTWPGRHFVMLQRAGAVVGCILRLDRTKGLAIIHKWKYSKRSEANLRQGWRKKFAINYGGLHHPACPALLFSQGSAGLRRRISEEASDSWFKMV